jgi:hypothetical protein
MADAEEPDGAMGLADFLTDLRAELSVAQQRAEGSPLRLGVAEVTVSLDLAVTMAKSADGSGKVSARFWVMNAELGGGGSLSSQRVRTQQLTLTLKPRIEEVVRDEQGRVRHVTSRGLDVAGDVEEGEEFPEPHLTQSQAPAAGAQDSSTS